jgi:hypothetical protein
VRLCWLGWHDWRLSASWLHIVVDDDCKEFRETGAVGYECRLCGRRKVNKAGRSYIPFQKTCAFTPWNDAIQWSNLEFLK